MTDYETTILNAFRRMGGTPSEADRNKVYDLCRNSIERQFAEFDPPKPDHVRRSESVMLEAAIERVEATYGRRAPAGDPLPVAPSRPPKADPSPEPSAGPTPVRRPAQVRRKTPGRGGPTTVSTTAPTSTVRRAEPRRVGAATRPARTNDAPPRRTPSARPTPDPVPPTPSAAPDGTSDLRVERPHRSDVPPSRRGAARRVGVLAAGVAATAASVAAVWTFAPQIASVVETPSEVAVAPVATVDEPPARTASAALTPSSDPEPDPVQSTDDAVVPRIGPSPREGSVRIVGPTVAGATDVASATPSIPDTVATGPEDATVMEDMGSPAPGGTTTVTASVTRKHQDRLSDLEGPGSGAGSGDALAAVPSADDTASSPVKVAHRAATGTSVTEGTVVWSREEDDEYGTILVAEVDTEGYDAVLRMWRNDDEGLAASHVLDVIMDLPEGLRDADGSIVHLGLRDEDDARSSPLSAVPVTVGPGQFFVGLEAHDEAVETNSALLTDKSILDVLVQFDNGEKLSFVVPNDGTGALAELVRAGDDAPKG